MLDAAQLAQQVVVRTMMDRFRALGQQALLPQFRQSVQDAGVPEV